MNSRLWFASKNHDDGCDDAPKRRVLTGSLPGSFCLRARPFCCRLASIRLPMGWDHSVHLVLKQAVINHHLRPATPLTSIPEGPVLNCGGPWLDVGGPPPGPPVGSSRATDGSYCVFSNRVISRSSSSPNSPPINEGSPTTITSCNNNTTHQSVALQVNNMSYVPKLI